MINKGLYFNGENNSYNAVSITTYFLAFYFLLAPFEDIIRSEQGTLLKYIALAFAFLSLALIIRNKTSVKLSDPIIILPIIMILLSYISIIWSIDRTITLDRNVAYLLLNAIFIVVYISNISNKEKSIIESSIIASALILSIYMLFFNKEFLYSDYGRMTLNNHNDPNNLAALLILPLFISFKNVLSMGKKFKILYIITFILLLYMTLMTGSRGALLSISISMLLFLFSYLKTKNKYKAKAILLILIIISSIILVLNFLPSEILQRLFSEDSFSRDFQRYGSRSDIWRNTIHLVIPNMPLWGYGSGCAPVVLSRYYGYLKGMHNTYLNMIIEYGIFGILIFGFFVLNIYKLLKNKKDIVNKFLFISILIVIFFLDSYAKKFFWNVLLYLMISSKGENGIE